MFQKTVPVSWNFISVIIVEIGEHSSVALSNILNILMYDPEPDAGLKRVSVPLLLTLTVVLIFAFQRQSY